MYQKYALYIFRSSWVFKFSCTKAIFRLYNRYMSETTPSAQKRAVEHYRKRLKERGIVRLEVYASETDAVLIRHIAKVLREESEQAVQVRKQIRSLIGPREKPSLKALLASAPLDGIDLSRQKDTGRKVDL